IDKGNLPKVNDVDVQLEQVDDLGEPTNAQRISEALAVTNDTLMVVGHVASTQTRAAIPAYLLKANPPVPLIMTTETNPNLLPPRASPQTYYPVFRLSPTDDDQAKKAVEFAMSKGAKTFWVIEDPTNPVYANFLARKFVENVHERSGKV